MHSFVSIYVYKCRSNNAPSTRAWGSRWAPSRGGGARPVAIVNMWLWWVGQNASRHRPSHMYMHASATNKREATHVLVHVAEVFLQALHLPLHLLQRREHQVLMFWPSIRVWVCQLASPRVPVCVPRHKTHNPPKPAPSEITSAQASHSKINAPAWPCLWPAWCRCGRAGGDWRPGGASGSGPWCVVDIWFCVGGGVDACVRSGASSHGGLGPSEGNEKITGGRATNVKTHTQQHTHPSNHKTKSVPQHLLGLLGLRLRTRPVLVAVQLLAVERLDLLRQRRDLLFSVVLFGGVAFVSVHTSECDAVRFDLLIPQAYTCRGGSCVMPLPSAHTSTCAHIHTKHTAKQTLIRCASDRNSNGAHHAPSAGRPSATKTSS